MITLILHEARAFHDCRGFDRITKAIQSTVSILWACHRLSQQRDRPGTPKDADGVYPNSDHFSQPFPPAKVIQAALAILRAVCVSLWVVHRYPNDLRVNQAANGKRSNYDGLVNLLDSIEHFLKRLDIYTQLPSTTAMDEIVVSIMAELLSTLALATKDLSQGRPSKFSLTNVLLYSVKHSQIRSRRQGRRGGLAKARPTHARNTAAQTLEVVHRLVRNISVIMDGHRP
jgi:hypothetical protein